MVRINMKRFLAFIGSIALILIVFFAIGERGSSANNPYVTTASIVKIPDNIQEAVQEETGAVKDIFAGTTSTLYTWVMSADYSISSTSATRVLVSNSVTVSDVIIAVHSTNYTVTFLHAAPSGNTASTITTSMFVLPNDVLGQYPFRAHVIGQISTTPIVLIYNPDQTTVILDNPSIVSYFFVRSFTTTISGVKHIYVTSVYGRYTITSANYTTEILH